MLELPAMQLVPVNLTFRVALPTTAMHTGSQTPEKT